MTKRLKLRNQTYVELSAEGRELSRTITRDWIVTTPQLRMRLEREVVINLENDDVDSLLRQRRKIFSECLKSGVSVVVEQVQRAPRFWLFRCAVRVQRGR